MPKVIIETFSVLCKVKMQKKKKLLGKRLKFIVDAYFYRRFRFAQLL